MADYRGAEVTPDIIDSGAEEFPSANVDAISDDKNPRPHNQIADHIFDVERRASRLIEKRDGRAVLALVQELISYGIDGFPAAVRLLTILDGYPHLHGIARGDIRKIFEASGIAAAEWILSNPSSTTSGLRMDAIVAIADRHELAERVLIQGLLLESDRANVHAISTRILHAPHICASDEFERAVELWRHDAQISCRLMDAIALCHGGEAALTSYAASRDSILRDAAATALLLIHPPTSGVLVQEADIDFQVQRGDLLLTIDGVQCENAELAHSALTNRQAASSVCIELLRNGHRQILNVYPRPQYFRCTSISR